ncbi:hypothetical protein [Pararhizobium arenae]|uniref:hypothetical protein n=1 Tax=Pararhizobium arenae TaxID=1856850 RepID=UPI00094B3614|nr:hypothetical protein [Pararhizobium arenae]
MRPINLLNATKVLLAALALIIGTIDIAAARDIDQRVIYRRGHHDRPDYSERSISSKNIRRHNDRRDWRADRRFERRRHREWRADNRRDRRFDRRREFVREYREPRGRGNVIVYGGGDGFPSPVPGIGTYAGNLSAWQDPGNGIYFSQDYYGGYGDVSVDVDLGAYLGGPQILDVDPQAVDNACSYEKGVCVIRRR